MSGGMGEGKGDDRRFRASEDSVRVGLAQAGGQRGSVCVVGSMVG